MMTIINEVGSIKSFNWAWQHRLIQCEEWVQFDCTDCLQLEFNYQALSLSKMDCFKVVKIIGGKVDLN